MTPPTGEPGCPFSTISTSGTVTANGTAGQGGLMYGPYSNVYSDVSLNGTYPNQTGNYTQTTGGCFGNGGYQTGCSYTLWCGFSAQGTGAQYLEFDFTGGPYNVQQIVWYAYNEQSGWNGSSIQTFTISCNNGGGWSDTGQGTQTAAQSNNPGVCCPGSAAQFFSVQNCANATGVRILPLTTGQSSGPHPPFNAGGSVPSYVSLDGIQFISGVGNSNVNYGINNYIGQTRRISNTSGTILFLEYNNQVTADFRYYPPATTVPQNTSDFATNVGCRHPAIPSTATGSGPTGLLNVGFVDGHVQVMSNTDINPATQSGGMFYADVYFTNYGPYRTD